MKTLYLDCGMGAAGDMLAAALLELLPDPDGFLREFNALGIPGVRAEREHAVKCGITGMHLRICVDGEEEESHDVACGRSEGAELHEHGHEHDHDHSHAHDHDHEHHHHDHDDECGCGHDHDHEHHHDHDEECGCGHHHDHHHHHADEVFTSWGRETIKKFTREGLEKMLESLSASEEYGVILRAKGMLPAEDGTWIYFDMVPEETEIREGSPEYTGRLCVIGSKLNEEKLAKLFGVA